MKRIAISAALVVAGVIGAGTALADGHVEHAIKARQAQMSLYAFNIGILAGMAKGEVEYNAESAAAAAGNLAALAQMNQSAMWPMGSDNSSGLKTRALPALWNDFPAVMKASNELKAATAAMADAAGTDLAALRGAIGPVGQACGSCHKPFRAEE